MCAGGVWTSWPRGCVCTDGTAETVGWKPRLGQAGVNACLRHPRSLFSSQRSKLDAGRCGLAPLPSTRKGLAGPRAPGPSGCLLAADEPRCRMRTGLLASAPHCWGWTPAREVGGQRQRGELRKLWGKMLLSPFPTNSEVKHSAGETRELFVFLLAQKC